jgi:hypothetical protein
MKKIIKITALILALICVGTSCASCGKKSPDSTYGTNSSSDTYSLDYSIEKSPIIGVGARIYVFGKSCGEIIQDFTIDKTTTSTEELLNTLKDLYAPIKADERDDINKLIFSDAKTEYNCLVINLNSIFRYTPYELHISITLPEPIRGVTLTCRKDPYLEYSGKVIGNFGTLSDDRKTLTLTGGYDPSGWDRQADYTYLSTLRIYYY